MNTLKIVLPFPASKLNPNRRSGHSWQVTAAEKVEAWQAGKIATLKALDGKAFAVAAPVKFSITFYCPNRRRRDIDNLLASLKPSLDGIAHATGIDDSAIEEMQLVKRYDLSNPRVEVNIPVMPPFEG
jgi:crossover junction endodeoxyribonuclease RusA